MHLQITEIYNSLQGEAAFAGYPCTFIRLTGCPLRCRWCDTVYGFEGGRNLTIEQVVEEVEALGCRLVELTGGEPLAQKDAHVLMQRLIAKGYKVLIETGGSESVADVPRDVHIIMDLKCPGSQMVQHNLYENIEHLKRTDEIKFVIANRSDFDWAVAKIEEYGLEQRVELLASAAFGLVAPKDLAEWILESKKNIRINLQQHKYIWSPKAKGV